MGNTTAEYQYKIRHKDSILVTGDAYSMGVVFGNLDGRTFGPNGINHQTHAQWLAWVAVEYRAVLSLGDKIELLNPQGDILQVSTIGKSCKDLHILISNIKWHENKQETTNLPKSVELTLATGTAIGEAVAAWMMEKFDIRPWSFDWEYANQSATEPVRS